MFAKTVVSLAASLEMQGSEFLINASNDLNAGTSAREKGKQMSNERISLPQREKERSESSCFG